MAAAKSQADPVALMEGAIDAVMVLKKSVREANERARVADDEAKMWKERWQKERKRVAQLEKELNLSSSRTSSPVNSPANAPVPSTPQKTLAANNNGEDTPATSRTMTPQEKMFAEESLVFYKPDDNNSACSIDPLTTSELSMPDIYTSDMKEEAEEEARVVQTKTKEKLSKKKTKGSIVGTPLKKAYNTTKKALKQGDK